MIDYLLRYNKNKRWLNLVTFFVLIEALVFGIFTIIGCEPSQNQISSLQSMDFTYLVVSNEEISGAKSDSYYGDHVFSLSGKTVTCEVFTDDSGFFYGKTPSKGQLFFSSNLFDYLGKPINKQVRYFDVVKGTFAFSECAGYIPCTTSVIDTEARSDKGVCIINPNDVNCFGDLHIANFLRDSNFVSPGNVLTITNKQEVISKDQESIARSFIIYDTINIAICLCVGLFFKFRQLRIYRAYLDDYQSYFSVFVKSFLEDFCDYIVPVLAGGMSSLIIGGIPSFSINIAILMAFLILVSALSSLFLTIKWRISL